MAVKRTIKERCDRCGEIRARLMPDGSVKVGHLCKKPVPGPQSPPYTYRPGEVIFEPAPPQPSSTQEREASK